MDNLKELIADDLKHWNNPYILEKIFHTADPKTVAEHINTFCERELGSGGIQAGWG